MTDQHPVTIVNWRSAMVWCNALTEWYNAQKGTSYACVYTSDAAYTNPIRDSQDGIYGSSSNPAAGSFDNPYVNPNAKGFRLLDTVTKLSGLTGTTPVVTTAGLVMMTAISSEANPYRLFLAITRFIIPIQVHKPPPSKAKSPMPLAYMT